MVIEDYWVLARIDGETGHGAHQLFADPKSALTGAFWPKIQFFALVTQFLPTGRILPYMW